MNVRGKHYTPIERKMFLQILIRYKDIIENKKSDGQSIKNKEDAWRKICDEFNIQQIITQERTIPQLKKLWTNMKHSQRDVLTKNKQARMGTGGGPEEVYPEPDPTISLIVPHLMDTAPSLFTSNMTDEGISERSNEVFNNVDKITAEASTSYDNSTNVDEHIEEEEGNEKEDDPPVPQTISDIGNNEAKCAPISLKKSSEKRKSRIRIVTEQEKTERSVRLQEIIRHEEELFNIRKDHEKELHEMKKQHLEELHLLNLREAKAKAEVAELELEVRRKEMELQLQYLDNA